MKKYATQSSLFILILLTFFGCSKPIETVEVEEFKKSKKEHTILAVLWQQHAAEYRALSYQAFNIATQKLQNLEPSSGKPYALITDIDETVLDNSPYSGMQVKEDADFNKEDWIEWGKLKTAEPVPGSQAFFNFADSLGVEVFYISNRYHEQLPETVENLKNLNYPNADASHVFLRKEISDKQERRDRVLKNYDVVLYMGDNLSDLSSVFNGKGTEDRNVAVDDLKASFGDKFIVFPNPMYGGWESGIYNGNRDLTDEQQDSLRMEKVKSYK